MTLRTGSYFIETTKLGARITRLNARRGNPELDIKPQ